MKKMLLGSLLGLVLCAGSSYAGSLGGRVWFADYTFHQARGGSDVVIENEMGTAPMFLVQLDGRMGEKMSGSLMMGAGQWDKDYDGGASQTDTRFDFLAGLSWNFKYWYIGAAVHPVIVYEEFTSAMAEESTFTSIYAGPEVLAGASFPILPDLLFVRGSVSALPIVGVLNLEERADGDTGDGSTTTYGYAFDVGLLLALSNWRLGGGWRQFNISDYDYTMEIGDQSYEHTLGEDFGGPYVMVSINW